MKPVVVIQCITYNHEAYIRDALEGFVMQQTDFPFVAIVHDDASTDGTAAIIHEYAEKYPDIIKPIYETENQYSKRDGSLRRIMDEACEATGAKYVALCEGDDYWTDPEKLQKQVDFLETHPDYSMCFHNAKTLMFDGSFDNKIYHISESRDYTPSEIIRYWTIPTASVVYRGRNINSDPVRYNPKFKFGDNVLFLTCAKYGKIFGINEYMSVYRKQVTSVTNSNGSIANAITTIEHTNELCVAFNDLLTRRLGRKSNAPIYVYLIRRHKDSISQTVYYLIKALTDARLEFVKEAFRVWILRK